MTPKFPRVDNSSLSWQPVSRWRSACIYAAILSIVLFGRSGIVAGATFVAPPHDIDIVGSVRIERAKEGESLVEIARLHDLGQEELSIANPALFRWIPVSGENIVLPTRYILPQPPREGIVVNLPEMRMYWYAEDDDDVSQLIYTHPVSIGQLNWSTPTTMTRIVSRRANPPWYPPLSIRDEAEQRGKPLPAVVPSGDLNPLGKHALYLDLPGYLLHGTNNPWAIGLRVTHGCLRLYPEDIAGLFRNVPDNTQVSLVNEPVKVGLYAGKIWLEVHPPLAEMNISNDELLDIALELIQSLLTEYPWIKTYPHIIRRAVERQDGIPVSLTISTLNKP